MRTVKEVAYNDIPGRVKATLFDDGLLVSTVASMARREDNPVVAILDPLFPFSPFDTAVRFDAEDFCSAVAHADTQDQAIADHDRIVALLLAGTFDYKAARENLIERLLAGQLTPLATETVH